MLETTNPEETNVLLNKPKPRMEGILNAQLETSQKEGISDTYKLKVMSATNHKCPHICVSKDLVFVIIILIYILCRDTSWRAPQAFPQCSLPVGRTLSLQKFGVLST